MKMVSKTNVIKALEKGLKIFEATQKALDNGDISERACIMLTEGQARTALTLLKDVRLGEWEVAQFNGDNSESESCTCSICTAIVKRLSKYCPSCGSYMINGRNLEYERKNRVYI